MSAKLLGIAFAARLGDPYAKLVLVKLVDCCRDDGSKIFPSVEEIVSASECSRAKVMRVLAEFCRRELLRKVRDGRGRGRATEYQLNVDMLRQLAEADERDGGGEGAPVNGLPDGPFAEPSQAGGDGGTQSYQGEAEDGEKGPRHGPFGEEKVSGEAIKGLPGRHNPLRGTLKGEREARAGARRPDGDDEGSKSQRGGAPAEALADALRRFRKVWPTTGSDNPASVEGAMSRLSPEEREAAIEGAPGYLAARKADGRTKPPTGATYLADRCWRAAELAGKAKSEPQNAGNLYAKPMTKLFWAAAIWGAEGGASPEQLKKRALMVRQNNVGWYVTGQEALAAVEALAETLQPASSDGAHAAAWIAWLAGRGFDMRDALGGKPFWVFLPQGPPGGRDGSGEADESADDWAEELARR